MIFETIKAETLIYFVLPARMTLASRIITTPAAELFDVDADCQFKCSVRKGDIRENLRGGTSFEFMAKISEGLGVAKAKVLSFVQRTMNAAQLISEDLYFKKSKGAAQSQYLQLVHFYNMKPV